MGSGTQNRANFKPGCDAKGQGLARPAAALACMGCWKVQRGNLVSAGEDTGESTTRWAHPSCLCLAVKLQVLLNLYCPQVV